MVGTQLPPHCAVQTESTPVDAQYPVALVHVSAEVVRFNPEVASMLVPFFGRHGPVSNKWRINTRVDSS